MDEPAIEGNAASALFALTFAAECGFHLHANK
jgi:hypothetical protein